MKSSILFLGIAWICCCCCCCCFCCRPSSLLPTADAFAASQSSTRTVAAKAKDDGTAKPSNKPRQQKRIKPVPYIATTSTIEHGRALSQYLKRGDRVLELGTQLDASTTIIRKAVGDGGSAVFVDVKRSDTNSGRSGQGSRNPEMFLQSNDNCGGNKSEYIELDHFAQWRTILDDNVETPFDVLVLDATAMLGNDLELTSLSVVNEFVDDTSRRGRRPRAVIVKSKSISSLSRRLIHAQRLFDGTVVRDFSSRSRDGKPYIIAGVGVEEYRRTIPHVVQEADVCLEVGCFSGTTTRIVHDAAKLGYCIGVDIGSRIIARAKQEHPDMHFAIGDAWKTLDMLRIKRNVESSSDRVLEGYDVVYADIGGLSGPDGTLESLSLLDALGYGLEPRCIVIKSRCMKRLASSLRAYSDVWEKRRGQNDEKS